MENKRSNVATLAIIALNLVLLSWLFLFKGQHSSHAVRFWHAVRGQISSALQLPPAGGAPPQDAYTRVPGLLGSCDEVVNSSFPFCGHDVFRDAADVIYTKGFDLGSLKKPTLMHMVVTDVRTISADIDKLTQPLVIVSNSNGDACVPFDTLATEPTDRPHYTKVLDHPLVRAWYGPNRALDHPKVKPMPLGNKWQWSSAKWHGEDASKGKEVRILSKWAADPRANFEDTEGRANLLLVQLNPATSDRAVFTPFRGHRRAAIAAAERVNQGKVPAVTKIGDGQYSCPSLPQNLIEFEDYLHKMRQYKFVLSPSGNGIDTHRTWEALLSGAIPVVESSFLNPLYEALPVYVITDWANLTEFNLVKAYDELHARRGYDWQRLFVPYWLGRMRADLAG